MAFAFFLLLSHKNISDSMNLKLTGLTPNQIKLYFGHLNAIEDNAASSLVILCKTTNDLKGLLPEACYQNQVHDK